MSVSSEVPQETRVVLRNVYVCYGISGALGLIYQILWLRKLLLVFGSTVHAVSTVLTVFFGGLALGSWFFGRLIDRREGSGLRWYAALEAGVGLYAFLTLPLFHLVQSLYIPVYRASGFSPTVLVSASFVCSLLILLVPTTLLGGTFPVLSRFLIRTSAERGIQIANLYGINTAGAMLGTLGVYFIGLPILGLQRTLLCAGVLNLGVGGLCAIFDRHLQDLGFSASAAPQAAPVDAPREGPAEGDRLLRWLSFAFALSGFSAMVYEVAWTRALSLVLGSSIYAFCIMLTTFLGGMALGSLVIRRDLRAIGSTFDAFIRFEWMLGAYGLCVIIFFNELPEWFVRLWPLTGGSFAGLTGLQFALSAAVMLIPTAIMGMLFPIVSNLVTVRLPQLGRRLGSLYAVNTCGGILGSFLAGFVLIPRWGLPWAMVAAAMVNLAAGWLIYLRTAPPTAVLSRAALVALGVAGALAVSGLVLVPMWTQQALAAGVYLNPQSYQGRSVRQSVARTKLLYYRDSLNATVSVHQEGESLFLKVGGKTDASNGADMGTQVLSAHIPLLLHPHPTSALVIGLGSGVTLGHVGRYPVSTIHCAELDPAVIEGARYFKAYNYGIHDDPRVSIIPADGRNFLLASPRQYDVIISEPSNPWMAGLAYLFTKEFYQLAKQRLAPGGVMCQWLQLYRIFPGDVKLMLKTFHEAFPYVSVWSSVPGDLLLIGTMEPQALDVPQLGRRMSDPTVREALSVVKVDRPELLAQLLWLGNRQVEQLTADVPDVHEDDRPTVEFNAPKALYLDQAFHINYDRLARFKAATSELVTGYDAEAGGAALHDASAALWSQREEWDRAQQALEESVRLDGTSSQRWVRLGRAALRAQHYVRGEAVFQQAVRVDPANMEAHALLGRLEWKFGAPDAAQRAYEQAASLQPPDAPLAEEIGRFFAGERHDFRWAVEYYRSALSQGGGEHPALVAALADALVETQAWDSAEQLLRAAVNRFPDEPHLPAVLGRVLLEQGRAAEAVSWLQRALTLQPNSADAYYQLGRIEMNAGARDEAIRYLRLGLAADPYHKEALTLLQQAAVLSNN